MPVALRAFLVVVDVGFVVYWLVSACGALPPEWLYAHHDDPVMMSWNWSFLPLDLVVSGSGLCAVFLARRGDDRWQKLALVSLAFTSASGLNAISFWALQRDVNISWWIPNLVLLLGPWPLLVGLLRRR